MVWLSKFLLGDLDNQININFKKEAMKKNEKVDLFSLIFSTLGVGFLILLMNLENTCRIFCNIYFIFALMAMLFSSLSFFRKEAFHWQKTCQISAVIFFTAFFWGTKAVLAILPLEMWYVITTIFIAGIAKFVYVVMLVNKWLKTKEIKPG